MNTRKLQESFHNIQQKAKEGLDISDLANELLHSIPSLPDLTELQKEKAAIIQKGRFEGSDKIKQHDIFRTIINRYEQRISSPENRAQLILECHNCVEEQKFLEEETRNVRNEIADMERKITFLTELAKNLHTLGGGLP